MNDLTIFDKLPTIFPSLWDNSGLEQMDNLVSGMNRLFRNNFNSVYPCDIYNKIKNGKKLSTVIELAAAGFAKEDCTISVKGNVLSLVLEKKQKLLLNSKEDFLKEYILKKIAQRTTRLSWTLSNTCDKKNIKVNFKNGILTIELPFTQPELPELTIILIK